MPGDLPPASGYTYAVEIGADAGQTYEQDFAPAQNLTHTFFWDGLDG